MMSRIGLNQLLLAVALMVSSLTLAACGGGGSDDGGQAATQSAQPPPPAASGGNPSKALAANSAQAGQIIDGSTDALEAKLASLRGNPVVINQWGSWCPPCREEFPFFGESAAAHASDVAFVGVDIQDDRGAAEGFLKEFPVPYPSIFDQNADAVQSIGWRRISPTTWFADRSGEIVYQRPGAYPDREALEADIQRYLLSG